VLFAVSNFLGPLLLGKLFDTVGRKPMIAGTYIGSAVVLTVLTILFVEGRLGLWGFMAFLLVTFFLASAGASSACLTVSEIFPVETRALAIAFFYATGTAVGGITGPFLFVKMIETGEAPQVAIASAERERRRRFRLGPGRTFWSPGMPVSAPTAEEEFGREVSAIERALADRGPTERRELSRLVSARLWGPGRFSAALREAVESGRARRVSRNRFGPAG